MMNGIFEFLAEPVVGSIIGILGILIGAIFAISFYYKSKIVSKSAHNISFASCFEIIITTTKNSKSNFFTLHL